MWMIYPAIVGFVSSLVTMPWLISWLKQMHLGQMIQEDGPKHAEKKHTPTMAGAWMITLIAVISMAFCQLNNPVVWLVLFVMVAHMLVGMVDDLGKIYFKNNDLGLRARDKFLLQLLIALVAVYVWKYLFVSDAYSKVLFPFFGLETIDLGFLYVPFALVMIVGTSNAVNLTDGLDGLVSVPVVCVCFGLMYYLLVGEVKLHEILSLASYHPHVADVLYILSAIIGVSIGFLWFNAHPADVFMGDSGSLALGAGLATVAMVLKAELVFAIMSGLFVIEVCSVIIQVLYFKLTKKRFFNMAPIHHHYELSGWHEVKVVTRFWLISMLFLCISTMMMH